MDAIIHGVAVTAAAAAAAAGISPLLRKHIEKDAVASVISRTHISSI